MAIDIPEPAERPRILVTEADFERAREAIRSDEHAEAWYDRLRERGDELLETPPREYDIPDGIRLLSVSREVLKRIRELCALHRLTDDDRYAERAWAELDSAAEFPDWNPSHFLDTAEMTAAFAVGLDWLYDHWTADQRARLRDAIVEKGLREAEAGYDRSADAGGDGRPNTWWTEASHNWNSVCNGGMTMGALAILGDDPRDDIIETTLHGARRSIERAIHELAPNGGWEEGPGYFRYNTQYLTYYLSSLRYTLGTDFGYIEYPGVDRIGDFPIYVTAPNGRPFDFCDSHTGGPIDSPALFWLARQFDRPEWAGYQLNSVGRGGGVQDLLWYDPSAVTDPETAGLDRDRYFPGAEESVTMRQAWNDPGAAFVGFKGGDNQVNHGDLDLGTFTFDADGVRWAVDLGPNDYNIPDYWDMSVDGGRWRYYRKRAEGHNTLVIDPGNGPDQHPFATAAITCSAFGDERAYAITDLSAAYPTASVTRGVKLFNGRERLVVQDEIAAPEPVDVWWFMHTEATIDVGDGSAVLEQDGETLSAAIASPTDATFRAMDAEPLPTSPQPEAEAPVEGVRKLAVRLEDVTEATIAIELGDSADGTEDPTPISSWTTDA